MSNGEKLYTTAAQMRLLELLAHEHGLTVEDVRSRSSTSRHVRVRRIFSKRLRDFDISFYRIGALLNRDHTTIIHYVGTPDAPAPMPWTVAGEKKRDWLRKQATATTPARKLAPYAGADNQDELARAP